MTRRYRSAVLVRPRRRGRGKLETHLRRPRRTQRHIQFVRSESERLRPLLHAVPVPELRADHRAIGNQARHLPEYQAPPRFGKPCRKAHVRRCGNQARSLFRTERSGFRNRKRPFGAQNETVFLKMKTRRLRRVFLSFLQKTFQRANNPHERKNPRPHDHDPAFGPFFRSSAEFQLEVGNPGERMVLRAFGRNAEKVVRFASATLSFKHHFPLERVRGHVAAFFVIGSRRSVIVGRGSSDERGNRGGTGLSVSLGDEQSADSRVRQRSHQFFVVPERISRETVPIQRFRKKPEERPDVFPVSVRHSHAYAAFDGKLYVIPPLLFHLRENFLFGRPKIEQKGSLF